MNGPNGHNLGGGPLHLSTQQRVALLRKIGLSQGWMLLTVAEMYEMKKAMDGATKENERLNKQTAKLIAKWVEDQAMSVKALDEARTVLKLVAEASNEQVSATYRFDALNALSKLDVVLKAFDSMPEEEKGGEDVGPESQRPA